MLTYCVYSTVQFRRLNKDQSIDTVSSSKLCTILCTAEKHIKDQSIDIGAVN